MWEQDKERKVRVEEKKVVKLVMNTVRDKDSADKKTEHSYEHQLAVQREQQTPPLKSVRSKTLYCQGVRNFSLLFCRRRLSLCVQHSEHYSYNTSSAVMVDLVLYCDLSLTDFDAFHGDIYVYM